MLPGGWCFADERPRLDEVPTVIKRKTAKGKKARYRTAVTGRFVSRVKVLGRKKSREQLRPASAIFASQGLTPLTRTAAGQQFGHLPTDDEG